MPLAKPGGAARHNVQKTFSADSKSIRGPLADESAPPDADE